MIIKTSNNYISRVVLMFCGAIYIFVNTMYKLESILISALFASIILIIAFGFWSSVGRTLIMDSEGCTVKFLCFHRTYKWSDFRIKQYVRFENALGTRDPFVSGAIFSRTKRKNPRWMKPSLYCDLWRPFNFYYVYFDVKKKPKDNIDTYVVNEEEFRAKMEEWGVDIQ